MDLLSIFHTGLMAIAALLAVPIAVLALECWAALRRKPFVHVALTRSSPDPSAMAVGNAEAETPSQTPTQQLAVLVPAHNEASGIRITLESLLPQVQQPQQIVVVADNCTDETAAIARSYGVTVLERNDPDHRGKGYALDHGVTFLRGRGTAASVQINPAMPAHQGTQGTLPDSVFSVPDVVFTVDADCRVHPQTLDAAATLARQTQQPVQVTNTLRAAEPGQAGETGNQLRSRLSSFAFRVHTFVRPNGLAQLGLPSTLHGTGMTFPWSVLEKAPLASDNIVEDMQLSLELILAGYHPLFCAEGEVSGLLPQQGNIATQQRTRWEHGHLTTLLTQGPRLMRAAWGQRRWELLAIALDLCVPPLSLLALLWLLPTTAALGLGGLTGAWSPALCFGLEGGALFLAILVAWARFGRDLLPLSALLAVPFYVLWKLPIYFSFLLQPERHWVRTERE